MVIENLNTYILHWVKYGLYLIYVILKMLKVTKDTRQHKVSLPMLLFSFRPTLNTVLQIQKTWSKVKSVGVSRIVTNCTSYPKLVKRGRHPTYTAQGTLDVLGFLWNGRINIEKGNFILPFLFPLLKTVWSLYSMCLFIFTILFKYKIKITYTQRTFRVKIQNKGLTLITFIILYLCKVQ